MNGAHHYEINLHQGDLFITLASDDVYFISKQMEKWFAVMSDDSYVPIVIPEMPKQEAKPKPKPEVQQSAPVPEPVAPPVPQPKPEPVAEVLPEPAPVVAPEPAPQPVVEENPDPILEDVAQNEDEILDELAGAFDDDVTEPEHVVAEFQEEIILEETVIEETVVMDEAIMATMEANSGEDDDFDAVMDTLMKDLDDRPMGELDTEPAFARPQHKPQQVQPQLPAQSPQTAQPKASLEQGAGAEESDFFEEALQQGLPKNDLPFDEMLEEAMPVHNNPVYANPLQEQSEQEYAQDQLQDQPAVLDLNTINSLSELCEQSRASSPEDFLILSAFFLTEIDGLDKFSLKKINSTLVQSGYTPVNHSVLENSISQDLMAMVPDMTGMADVSEYALTEAGQEKAEILL